MKKIIRSVGVCFAIAAIIFTGVLLWGTVAQASAAGWTECINDNHGS